MTDSKIPRPRPRPAKGRPGPARRSPAGRGLSRRELVSSVAAHLETPFLEVFPDTIRLFDEEVAFEGSTGRRHVLVPEREVHRHFSGSSMERMILRPRSPLEHRRWSRIAAMVILGIR